MSGPDDIGLELAPISDEQRAENVRLTVEAERRKYRCPAEPRFDGDLVGCGLVVEAEIEPDGWATCPECGLALWPTHVIDTEAQT